MESTILYQQSYMVFENWTDGYFNYKQVFCYYPYITITI